MSFLSEEEIRATQDKKVRTLFSYLQKNSPYYRELFHSNGLKEKSFGGIRDLSNIPLTNKAEFQQRNNDFLCVSRHDIAEYTTTSGTSGSPVSIALTKNDLLRLAYNEYCSFITAGMNEKSIVQLMLTLDRLFMAGIAYYHGVQKLGATVIRTGPGLPALQFDHIQRFSPDVIVAVPSFILKLIEYAHEKKIVLNELPVKKIICIGENIRYPDFTLNVLGQQIVSSWNINLVSTYASTEMQTAFCECQAGQGGHLLPDLLIAEVLDETRRPVKEGEPGELVITTLGIEGMPLLRYATGDIVCMHHSACSCGRVSPRISPVLGRKNQMIKLKGTTLYPTGIFDIILSVDHIADFAIVAETGKLETDDLTIFLNAEEVYHDHIRKSIQDQFHSLFRVMPNIRFTDEGHLLFLQKSESGRKLNKFIDHRQNFSL
ncbi:MAG: AMP-binding protein [Crocinitomicaceae bacterium]|nr:AMP-binding protein [Crocinitomicaceae bacterium]